jgi:hypothetical protein
VTHLSPVDGVDESKNQDNKIRTRLIRTLIRIDVDLVRREETTTR